MTTTLKTTIYTAHATVSGGREGHGETSDGALSVDLGRPPELGGEGGATNPEQLFAIGYAACFGSALAQAVKRARLDAGEVSIASSVSLVRAEDGAFGLAVELDVRLPGLSDPEQAAELVAAAHQVCPYSRATRGNIPVALVANGHRLD
jgi:Ohr subfamily peroxiredoxin